MVAPNGLPKTLSEVFCQEPTNGFPGVSQQSSNDTATTFSGGWRQSEFKAKNEWSGAIAALEQLLLTISTPDSQHHYQGLLLSGPAPILSHSSLISRYYSGIFTADSAHSPYQLPAAQDCQDVVACSLAELSLLPHDPIATEQFCLVLTSRFSLLMVLGQDRLGLPAFQFSFEPNHIHQAWIALRWRLVLTHYPHLEHLDNLVERFVPLEPDYRLVTYFSQQILKHLPSASAGEVKKTRNIYSVTDDDSQHEVNVIPLTQQRKRHMRNGSSPAEVELLQALTHEIRTPLTTIRTITRSLLKRTKLDPNVVKRLEAIDQECTEQINRMELIFRAAELVTRPLNQDSMGLAPISLKYLFEQSIPCWQKQAQRRNVELDVVLPNKLPTVVSDPGMLNQILTGLMEKFTRSLPNGGKIRVEVTTAGSQLKLQLQSSSNHSAESLKFFGHLLMFQPETGNLSLNLDAAKNLFQAMGGKLIVRQRPQQGETVTIFLPLVTHAVEPDTPAEIFY